jgi:hypothetical protein
MKDIRYYDALPWEVQIERDLRKDGSPGVRHHLRAHGHWVHA